MEFKVKYKNERDIEIPLLIDFIKKHPDVEKVLDVGCARSLYIPLVKNLTRLLDCVDFERDEKLAPIFDNYFFGDATEVRLGQYDLVSAISVVEHYGVKQKPVLNYQDRQIALVEKIGQTAKKYVFLTFPYGELALIEGEFAVVDDVLLSMFEDVLDDFKLTKEFYFNINPQSGAKWIKTTPALASVVKHDPDLGVRCICILKGVRDEV